MKLRIVTPLDVIVDEDDVAALRAEDASGSFGILSGHAPFLTTLATTVIRWTGTSGNQRYCAVRGGVLSITDGKTIAVATREAVAGDDLAVLDQQVIARFRADRETERIAHFDSNRLQLTAIRHIISHLQPSARSGGGDLA